MTAPDDPHLVDYLYDELTSEQSSRFERLLADDAEARQEVESLEAALESLRSGLPAEEPAPQLDAKILAYARQAAAKQSEQTMFGKLRKFLRSPTFGLVAAGSLALIAGFVIMPQMKSSEPNYDAYRVASEAQRPPVAARAPASAPVQALADAPAEAPAGVGRVAKLEEKKAEPSKEVAAQRAEPELARKKAKAARDLEGWEAEQDGFANGTRANTAATGGAAAGPANKVVARFDAPKDEAAPEPDPAPAKQDADKGGRGDSLAAGEGVGGKRESTADVQSKTQPMAEEAADDAAEHSERRSRSADDGLAKKSKAPASAAPTPSAAPSAGVALSPPSPRRSASGRPSAAADAEPASSPAALVARARHTAANGDPSLALKLLQRATALARGRPEEGNILLDAADIALALREPASAEQYARAAERLPNFTRVAEARRTVAKARVMRSESAKPAATPTY